MHEIIIGDGFYISYVEEADKDPVVALIGVILGKPQAQAETALCIPDESKFTGLRYHILNGDFREEYRKRIHSLESCLEFFKTNIEHQSVWSDSLTELNS